MTIRKVLGFMVTAVSLQSSFAMASVELMVSINKDKVMSVSDVFKALPVLTQNVVASEGCSASSVIKNIVDFGNIYEAPYHAIAIVELQATCKQAAEILIHKIETDGRFSNWSNGQIDPFPAVSAGN